MDNNNSFQNKNTKVLVVDDDVVSRMLLSEILKDCNMAITIARNGLEAVEKVKADSTFDFILMDLKMPIMNGYEATEAIRGFGYTKPIIAQTAYASIEDKSKVNSLGFSAYLSKPISKVRLLDLLQKLLGQ
jgi:CheY-like chemotaxis protein